MFMHVYASGGKTAPVVAHVFENGHFCPSHALVTLRHMGCVNVHVNLRHMHMLRCVTGLGGVNVHVSLRHMHMLRYVTWGGC